ncbi:MAG TPA: Ldh family oxidoreductase [Burkholderiales bacterium]
MSGVPAERLQAFIAAAFEKVGMPASDARTVAGLMADADLHGADGHGVFRLPQYIRRIEAGGINLRPEIKVLREKPGSALVDGDNGMGHLVMKFAAQTAIAKARASGAAWVGVRHGNHAGPASLYARMPASQDMVGLYLAVGNANHLPPWGGIEMLLSTNPIAIAVPAGEEPSIVLDMATTVAAYGKVKTKAQRGEAMPEGWMVDRDGQPLTDPKRANDGFLLPIGGYKGYGLALVFGLLAGTLNGAAMGRDVIDFNADDATPTNTGQAILAIDVAAFGDAAEFKRRVDALARDIRGSKKMRGFERIWLPGEQSRLKFLERSKAGVPVAATLMKTLDELAARLGIEKLTAR